jgi:hypothetical protein
MMSQEARTRLTVPDLAFIGTSAVQEMAGNRIELELVSEDGRLRGQLVLPPAFGGMVAVDLPFPVTAAEAISLEQIITALPLAPGSNWTLQAFNSFARAVVPYQIVVGDAESVPVGKGEVRAFPVMMETTGFQQKLWISESQPSWVVASEVPTFGMRFVAREMPR